MTEQKTSFEGERKNIFEKYVSPQYIFRNDREMLRPSYVPRTLPHREKEIDQLAGVISPSLKGNRPSNVLIFGKTGTGKTATVRFVASEALKMNGTAKLNFIYVNCCEIDTNYAILQHVINRLVENPEERAPYNGWSLERLYSVFREILNRREELLILILDELDRLVYKSGDDLLYNLTRMNDDMEKSKITLIGIANDLKFTDYLDARVRSRLSEERIVFSPYNAGELSDILKARCELVFYPEALETDVIPLCSALAAQEHGDARRALELLRVAAEYAERAGERKVTTSHVMMAKNKIELDTVTEAVRTLPFQSKLLLLSVVMQSETKKVMTTGDIYATYHNLCDSLGVVALTQRRIGDLVSELDMLGIVRARVRSFGRGGRTREIELSVPLNETREVLASDELLGQYKSTRLRMQTTLI
ncbi:MAG: ORC1-type DNA replication protein [Methanomassiliicoccales archaeon]